jgi:hypothetical protein
MTETILHPPRHSDDDDSPERHRTRSFLAVAAVIVVGLSLLLGLALLLSRLLGNPSA